MYRFTVLVARKKLYILLCTGVVYLFNKQCFTQKQEISFLAFISFCQLPIQIATEPK